MNALARTTLSSVPRVTARSTGAIRPYSRQTVANIQAEHASVWFKDPSTYPVIGITAIACVGCTAYLGYIHTQKEYIQWNKNKRGSVIRWWGDDKAHLRVNKN
mmetsp:Transcript_33909/g.81549  ORF Transcript_33909/g.81549 Transcript_33909/m.81549 type:complete len:103 (+) Transcript_33909:217-525(+)|eukprot:CAMPEP_0113482208 /NCGR_PEP_ID=MMETSP0014_2-20120614/22800_1 /TAXON_ID=2857 /ORGANISM="Nitzschia sp." /LENGTH=102 /DNA_ID=CAMNT_0000375717 /DNA_START=195 /DNA_END=503 /DNA_ORIENTATION=+ /assembly_acc=CAM_ASM_000159